MTLDGLRCFCAVVDAGNFRLAAEQVHRSQPAVSQQIKSLERELGATILDRKSAKPTPAGLILLERARELIAGADDVVRAVHDFDEGSAQELRVGASDTVALYLLPPIVRKFARAMPRTRLVIRTRSSDLVTQELVEGNLDLAIVTLPSDHEGTESREVLRQKLVLVVPKGHRFARQRRIALTRLRDEPLVLLHADTRTGDALRRHFRKAGFDGRVALDSGSFEVVKRYVGEGVGIGFVPEMALSASEKKQLAVLEVPGLPSIPIGVVRRRDAYETKAARAFLALLAPSRRRGAVRSSGLSAEVDS